MTRLARATLAALFAVSRLSCAGVARAEEPVEPPVVTVPVVGDREVDVVYGPKGSTEVLVYLHGVCGDPLAFRSWRAAAADFATLISVRGDEPCPHPVGRAKWSFDYVRNDRRLTAAIRAVDAQRRARGEASLDPEHLTVVGYSQGAIRAEGLARAFPQRYRRVAMIANPGRPSPAGLSRGSRFLIMGGGHDARSHLIEARRLLERAGLTVAYAELPRARHGEYGPEALRAMRGGLEWLFKNLP